MRFFRSAAEARAAGFRPCKRCKPGTARRAAHWIRFVATSRPISTAPVPLAELGRVAGLSPFTVQRLFKQEMGVSPLQYQRALRAGSLRGALKQGDTVTNAIYEAGFGSSSRAYEGAQLGMTPARFAQGGTGEQIGWATAPFAFRLGGGGSDGARAVLAGAGGHCGRGRGQPARGVSRWPTLRRDPSLSRLVDAAVAQCAPDEAYRKSRPQRSWICAGRRFNCGCGRRCARFRAARRAVTASWRARWAIPRRPAPWPAPAPRIAWHWWCRAIAWWAPAARSPAIGGEWSASANCWKRKRAGR